MTDPDSPSGAAPSTPPAKKRGRFRRAIYIGMRIFLVLVAGILIYWVYQRIVARKMLAAAEKRFEVYKQEYADLVDKYEDASPIWQPVFDAMPKNPQDNPNRTDEDWKFWDKVFSNKKSERPAGWVDDSRWIAYEKASSDFLRLALAAGKTKPAIFRVDYSMDMATRMDFTQSAKDAAAALAFNSRAAAERGRFSESIALSSAMLKLSDDVSLSPSYISFLLCRGIESVAIPNLDQALALGSCSIDDLAAIEAGMLAQYPYRNGFAQSILGERLMSYPVFRAVVRGQLGIANPRELLYYDPTGKSDVSWHPIDRFTPVSTVEGWKFLDEYYGRWLAQAERAKCYQGDAPVVMTSDELTDQMKKRISRGPGRRIAALSIPIWDNIFKLKFPSDTRWRLTLLSARLLRHAADHGRYPDAISALARPGDPEDFLIDPMCGEPFRYRIEPDGGVRLWSVWYNQKDDGGEPKNGWTLAGGMEGKDNDAVVALPAPKK
jgi:hypothetical protein